MASHKITLYPINHAKCFFSFFIVQFGFINLELFLRVFKNWLLFVFVFISLILEQQVQLILSTDHELKGRNNTQKNCDHNVNMAVGSLVGQHRIS